MCFIFEGLRGKNFDAREKKTQMKLHVTKIVCEFEHYIRIQQCDNFSQRSVVVVFFPDIHDSRLSEIMFN